MDPSTGSMASSVSPPATGGQLLGSPCVLPSTTRQSWPPSSERHMVDVPGVPLGTDAYIAPECWSTLMSGSKPSRNGSTMVGVENVNDGAAAATCRMAGVTAP